MLEQIKILTVHYTLSDTTKTFIEEKLTKLDYLKKIVSDGTIRIIRDNEHYKVEADIHLKNKHRTHIEETNEQLYPAIENLIHTLKHTLSIEHKKITSHKNHEVSDLKHGDNTEH